LSVYAARERLGFIEDWGRGDVRAFVIEGDSRSKGKFETRAQAIRAVEAAALKPDEGDR
jgi:hypothetical protein